MKSFAFGDGEAITSLAGERTWIAASGFNGDRLFYRKAALACGGDRWHHIAFEYPANAKRSMQDVIRRAVEMLDSSQNTGCDTHFPSLLRTGTRIRQNNLLKLDEAASVPPLTAPLVKQLGVSSTDQGGGKQRRFNLGGSSYTRPKNT
jgi:hypothetical protein